MTGWSRTFLASIEIDLVAIFVSVDGLIEGGREGSDTELAKVGQLFVVRRDE